MGALGSDTELCAEADWSSGHEWLPGNTRLSCGHAAWAGQTRVHHSRLQTEAARHGHFFSFVYFDKQQF